MTVVEMPASAARDAVVPALAVLVALSAVLGGVAVYFLNRASSSEVR